MNITDVPQSGVYIQQGSIFELVVQIIDLDTGLPVQLQTANDLQIGILYPDRVTAVMFQAELYADGSDGKIAYTTQYSDLSQIGLYQFQGNATIGGIAQPPSLVSDFYVLPNVMAGIEPSVVLQDSAGGFWQVTVLPAGNLKTTPVTNPSIYQPALYLTDQNGKTWTITVLPTGNLNTN